MTSEERREARYQRRRKRREEKKKAVLAEYGDFYRAMNRNALSQAAREAAQGVKYKASVKRFMQRRLLNIGKISRRMEQGKDIRKGFICFYVVERGKLRRIMSVHFSERVPQKSLNQNVLIPVLSRSLIHDNGASRKGMGTSFTLRRAVANLRRYYNRYGNQGYVLQVDIKNYFGSIDHETIKGMVADAFDDFRVVQLTFSFIDAYYEYFRKQAILNGQDPKSVEAKGLGLGGEINQTMAVVYLNPVDHFIKEVLRIRGYARYNDDLYLFHPDKGYLQYCLVVIKSLCERLKVEVNERKTGISKLSHGFTFLKTQIFLLDSGKVLRKPCRDAITRERRKLKRQKKLVDAGQMSFEDVRCSFASWLGSMKGKQARRSVYQMKMLFNRLFIYDWLYTYQPIEGVENERYRETKYREPDQHL